MSTEFQHYSFRMPNIGFQNLLLFCCYLIRIFKTITIFLQVIQKEKVKELNLHEVITCMLTISLFFFVTVCRCLIKWLEVRKVCPLCNMPVLQLAQQQGAQEHGLPQQPLPGVENLV
uniref:Ring finger protein 24 n=1 Tax=Erpetoichthys calabaricus TaxID=27687 RepID=A0A8C4T471_ERPCA